MTIDNILDACGKEIDTLYLSYNMMCMMLDNERIKARLSCLGNSEIYVYGAGYLGIQFVHAVKNHVSIVGVIDSKERTVVPTDIEVISIDKFVTEYNGQKVIIASIDDCRNIKYRLKQHIKDSNILYLNEFLGGIL